jgi:hypothetical protein
MNRIKDYTCFAACFVGLGYIVLWPITANELNGEAFGASVVCHDGSFGIMDFICSSSHPLRMAPGLHAIGFMSAVFVTTRLLYSAVKRSRLASRARGPAASSAAMQTPDEPAVPPPRKPRLPRSTVKPRTHFGLRGVPH